MRSLKRFPGIDFVFDVVTQQTMVNKQRQQILPIPIHSTADIIKCVLCRQDAKPDSSLHAVKEPWKQFEWRIILSLSFGAVFDLFTHRWIFFLLF
jgi:hypothetical protein